MIEFLTTHFRYDTMNSWNGSTSWANNLKVYNVIPNALRDKVFELLEVDDFFENINCLIRDYNINHNWSLQAGFNGRSAGYLVMYEGEKKLSEHKSYCTTCYQRNFKTIEESSAICGKCGNPTRINHIFYDVFTKPGRSIDNYDEDDYKEMDIDSIRQIVKKVQEFDKLCDAIVAETIYMAENCTVEEEEYTVTKTRKVMI